MMDHEAKKTRQRKAMEINLDRPRRVRSAMVFWLFLFAVAALLAFLLLRFTGSKVVAFGLAGGMLLYMLLAGAVTSRHLSQMSQNSGDGRLD